MSKHSSNKKGINLNLKILFIIIDLIWALGFIAILIATIGTIKSPVPVTNLSTYCEN